MDNAQIVIELKVIEQLYTSVIKIRIKYMYVTLFNAEIPKGVGTSCLPLGRWVGGIEPEPAVVGAEARRGGVR